MIEYAKVILPKVSKWKPLFRKELMKCVYWVEPDELQEFYNWCHLSFTADYPEILEDVFAHIEHKQNKEGILKKMKFDDLTDNGQLQKTA